MSFPTMFLKGGWHVELFTLLKSWILLPKFQLFACRTEYFCGKYTLPAHCLKLKARAVPAIKDPGHDSAPEAVSETASFCVMLAIGE